MSRGAIGTGELDFLQAFVKRGFVSIPRMLCDYMAELGIDYSTIGKLFVLLAFVGNASDSAFGPYLLSRRTHPHDFDQMRSLVVALSREDLVRFEDEDDLLRFDFGPLFSFLRVHWAEHEERMQEEQVTDGPDPVMAAAQKLLGRPLSDREAKEIQDWVSSYDFDVSMVQAVIREGQRQGVTRMNYLNQIALRWHEAGIRTPEEAEQEALSYRKSVARHKVITSYLGIKQLSGAQQAVLDRWSDEWGFSNEVIMKACDLAAGSQNPLQYANKVLENWKDRGVRTVADADQLEAEHKRRSVAAASDPGRAASRPPRSAPQRNSNVFLKREKQRDAYYDQILKKLDD